MAKYISNYNQTTISYKYDSQKYYSMSGIIENENNIWMHPPRNDFFKILELNPFPFVMKPLEIGNRWNWKLKIGSQWGDFRWKTWNGEITNLYNYQITKKETTTTKFGELKCYIIECVGDSKLGKTKLITYFNEKYGFIKLNYINIDGSKTNLELVDYQTEKSTK